MIPLYDDGVSRDRSFHHGGNPFSDHLQRASVELLRELLGRTGSAGEETDKLAAYVHVDASDDFAEELLQSLREISCGYLEQIPRVKVREDAAKLLEMLSQPAVSAITLVERLQPSMNYAALACSLPEFKYGGGSGKNVLVGIIDSGVDSSHPMFAGRIAAVWDQTAPWPPVGGVPFGRLLTGRALQGSTDQAGHGTHVAGIATGNDPVYGGVAEGATLVVVKSELLDADVEAALYWLKDYAVNAGLPMVVNLSMEGRSDPHDGSGSLCESINELSGPGFIVCCASGNTGGEACHAEVAIPPGECVDVPFDIVRAPDVQAVAVKGWANSDADLSLGVTTPRGTYWSPAGTVIRQFVVSQTIEGTDIDLVLPKTEPAFDDATGFLVSFKQQSAHNSTGRWTLTLRNEGNKLQTVHLWSTSQDEIRFDEPFMTDRVKIAAPGSARRAITIGAFATRNAWQDEAGTCRVVNAPNQRFQVAAFSSPGPLRSLEPKPELVAPGTHICSARSSTASVPLGYGVSTVHRIMSGTSMATPFIAGVVALMLEANAQLNPEEAKGHLISISAIPGLEPGEFDESWGYGVPDLARLSLL